MAITAANTTWLGTAGVPAKSGQILATGGSDQIELAYKGTATITLDGTTTAAVINYIDGTQTLPFTPSAVMVTVTGGTQGVQAISAGTITTTGFTVNLAAAGTAANTLIVVFVVFK